MAYGQPRKYIHDRYGLSLKAAILKVMREHAVNPYREVELQALPKRLRSFIPTDAWHPTELGEFLCAIPIRTRVRPDAFDNVISVTLLNMERDDGWVQHLPNRAGWWQLTPAGRTYAESKILDLRNREALKEAEERLTKRNVALERTQKSLDVQITAAESLLQDLRQDRENCIGEIGRVQERLSALWEVMAQARS